MNYNNRTMRVLSRATLTVKNNNCEPILLSDKGLYLCLRTAGKQNEKTH
jgi:hypothetical protein